MLILWLTYLLMLSLMNHEITEKEVLNTEFNKAFYLIGTHRRMYFSLGFCTFLSFFFLIYNSKQSTILGFIYIKLLCLRIEGSVLLSNSIFF